MYIYINMYTYLYTSVACACCARVLVFVACVYARRWSELLPQVHGSGYTEEATM
jgi:hypothetical protein